MEFSRHTARTTDKAQYDGALRKYMLSIYNNMSVALLITAVVSYLCSQSEAFLRIMYTDTGLSIMGYVIIFAPLAFVFYFGAKAHTMEPKKARIMLFVYAGLMGLSLTSIFLVYTMTSIFGTFLVSSATFGSMSLFGYTTKKDISGWGSFLFMGVIGLLIASLANWFFHSPALHFAISAIGVLIFAGLTAYDTQKLKRIFYEVRSVDQKTVERTAIIGAFTLYIDFINLFLFLLRLMGNRR